jgi:predicted transcriptional regulator
MKEITSFLIDPADLEALKEIARKEDTTVSRLIRLAIKEYLKTITP